MSDIYSPPPEAGRSRITFFGHPIGLATLFFTEMWERFSYYGMRALLVLFMTASVEKGGLGFTVPHATSIYGNYTFFVYLTPLLGGFIADKLLGARRAVLLGGIIIASGHFCMLLNNITTFYLGLVLIVAGTGLLKPNVSTMVGDLYSEDDARRDSGFSIFYMGINLGAFIAPLITGYLGQKIAWHYGFAAAGFGMVLGVIQYVLGSGTLGNAGMLKKKQNIDSLARPEAKSDEVIGKPGSPEHIYDSAAARAAAQPGLTPGEVKRLIAIAILVVFSILFFMAFEQQGSSMNLFADRLTNLHVLGKDRPSSWFQSVEPFFVITLAPVLAWIWLVMRDKQPSSPVKFALGLLIQGLGYIIMVIASTMTSSGLVSPWWLIGAYFLISIGELCLSPVGLSIVTQLAPARYVGLMMGLWFFSIAMGNKLAGLVAGMFEAKDQSVLVKLFGGLAAEVIVAAVILFLMTPFIKRLMSHDTPAKS